MLTAWILTVAALPGAAFQDSSALPDAATPRFDSAAWELRLALADLDRREAAYAELLELASSDARAAAWIHDAARRDGELAWTLRLLERELAAAGPARRAGAPRSETLAWPFGQDPFAGMYAELERLWGGLGDPSLLGRGSSSSSSIEIRQDGGRTTVTVTETTDAGESTRTYEGESLAEILRAHPELSGRIGVSGRGLPGGLARRVAPPSALVDPLVDNGAEHGAAAPRAPIRTDVLGVYTQPLEAAARAARGLAPGQGLLVTGVLPGSIAEAIGLAPGDALVEVGGLALYGRDDVSRALAARGADDELSVSWLDAGGQRRTRTWRPRGGVQDGATSVEPREPRATDARRSL
jgi:hypothetical protein